MNKIALVTLVFAVITAIVWGFFFSPTMGIIDAFFH
jgi:hypothetical protein